MLHAIQQQSTRHHPSLYRKTYKAARLLHEMENLGTQGESCLILEILLSVISSFLPSSGNLLLLKDCLFEYTLMLPEIGGGQKA